MEPVTIALIITGILLSAALVHFWPWIVDFFVRNLIPWVRRLSPGVGDVVENLIVWADGKITLARGAIRQCIAKFKETIMGATAEYEKVSATSATRTVTTHVLNEKGKVVRQVVTEEVPYDELPQAIREEMHRQQKRKASLDVKAAVLKKVDQRAKEEGLVLEEAVVQ